MGCSGGKAGSPSVSTVDLIGTTLPLARGLGIQASVGDQLQCKDGLVPTTTALKNKTAVLLYSAVASCPKCREFTAMLIELYNTQALPIGFDVVFVSGDESRAEFDRHFSTMPWYAVPFGRGSRTRLRGNGKSRGPSLTLLGLDGSLLASKSTLDLDFAACVGANCAVPPIRRLPQPTIGEVRQALGDTFVKADGTIVGEAVLDGRMLGIYFGASWCPPCRNFIVVLNAFYQEYRKEVPDFEVVFVSSDSDEQAMMSYAQDMHADMLSMPFSNRKGKVSLTAMLGVQGLPTLVILDAEGRVVSADARCRVEAGVVDVLAIGWAPAA